MADARRIVFVTDQQRGVGTRMEIKTAVGPFRTIDQLEVTGWDEGHGIDVIHTGLVTGVGRLSLTETYGGTIITWEESLRFPWWLGGSISAWLARPILERVWSRNLKTLESLVIDP